MHDQTDGQHPTVEPDPTDEHGLTDRRDAADGYEGPHEVPRLHEEAGSLVTEYGLLAVVAATVAGVIIEWASGGALVTLFNALLRQARALVGA